MPGENPTENRPKSDFHTWIDTLNKIVQILAVVVVGIWTWSVFSRTSAPGLETKLGTTSNLYWAQTGDKKHCRAMFSVDVKNDGQRSFDINDVSVTAWAIPLQQAVAPATSGMPSFLDPEIVKTKGKQIYSGDAAPIHADIVGHYSPGSHNSSEAEFLFDSSKDTFVVFSMDVSGEESKVLMPFTQREKLSSWTWASDVVCGVPK